MPGGRLQSWPQYIVADALRARVRIVFEPQEKGAGKRAVYR